MSELFPQEKALAEPMSAARQQSFSSGRYAAHHAQACLYGAASEIGRNERVPQWVEGWGSISHSEQFAAAIVAHADTSVGLDIEQCGRVREALWPKVFTAQERCSMNLERASLAFAAKEAGYKATYPIAHSYISFHEAEVDLDEHTETYRLRYLGSNVDNKVMDAGIGHYKVTQDHVLSIFRIPLCKPS